MSATSTTVAASVMPNGLFLATTALYITPTTITTLLKNYTDMKKITLDFENISNKEEMHKYLAEKFEFPDYYGGNLDALFECLTDIAEPTAVNIINAINDYDEQIINVITSAEEENDNLAVFVN